MKETLLSLIRHAASLLGGVLLAKGFIDETVALWLPGAVFVLAGALCGAFDEYKATGRKPHFGLSIVRHTLTAAGGYFAAAGKIGAETAQTIVGAVLALIGAIWGGGDEALHAAGRPRRRVTPNPAEDATT
jgi:hypothetical protein